MKITENLHFCVLLWNTVKEYDMEITYKKGALTIRLVKHNKRGNFWRILYRIAKNLLWRGHGPDLVQLTHVWVIPWNSLFRSSSAIMDFTKNNLPGGQVGLWPLVFPSENRLSVRQTTQNDVSIPFLTGSVEERINTYIDVSENTMEYYLRNVKCKIRYCFLVKQ